MGIPQSCLPRSECAVCAAFLSDQTDKMSPNGAVGLSTASAFCQSAGPSLRDFTSRVLFGLYGSAVTQRSQHSRFPLTGTRQVWLGVIKSESPYSDSVYHGGRVLALVAAVRLESPSMVSALSPVRRRVTASSGPTSPDPAPAPGEPYHIQKLRFTTSSWCIDPGVTNLTKVHTNILLPSAGSCPASSHDALQSCAAG